MTGLLRASRLEVGVLGALLAFTLLAAGGYGFYALHPERIPQTELALSFFTISFQLFARFHIVLAALALGVVLVGRLGLGWLPALGVVYVLSFLAEHIGTGYGVPFGGYGYTGLLGYKLGGRVPVLIPLSWFLMALPAWAMARQLLGPSAGAASRVLLGSLWLVAWDLALDPAMSFLTAYWRWEESGPYYGMPWLNLLGWYVTGIALLSALEAFDGRLGLRELPARWLAAYYVVVALMPLGMLAAAGAWLGVVVTFLGMAGCVLVLRVARRALEAGGGAPSPEPASAQ